MKKFLLLILLFISSIGVSQDFSDGMVVVEFNASFNKSNEVTWLSKLSDCEVQRVDIAADSRWASEYKIVVVPTLVIFNNNEEAKKLPLPPDPEITRMEYDMKDQLIRQTIMSTQEDVKEIKDQMIRVEEKIDKLK